MLELYHHGSSVCAAKVRLVLAEKGLEWTGHYLDILRGDQFDPEYLKLNPKAVVPTLVHDGQVVRESTVICEYLDDAFPDTPLKPESPLARARMRLWTKFVDEKLHEMCAVLTFASSHRHTIARMSPEEVESFLNSAPDPEWRRRKREWVELGFDGPDAVKSVKTHDTLLGDMEKALAEGPWLAGETYSLADVGVTPYVNRLDMLGMSGIWKDTRPHVTDWFDRIRERASFQPGIYDYIPEDLIHDLNENGSKSWPTVREILQAA